jgi:LmbE family N-acetylglucosaminyl deacetylase
MLFPNADTRENAWFRDMPLTNGRVVVISPHLDDAVMSIGATIAHSVNSGATVEVLTVFGYGPTSPAPAGPWDAKSGFHTEGEAATARRQEDQKACRILGATPRWLDYGAEPYERRGTPQEIKSAVWAAVADADCVLVPGFPLTHPDHLELTQLVLAAGLRCPIGLYAEQPYLYYERKSVEPSMLAPAIASVVPAPAWTRVRADSAERRMKIRAVRAYKSQLWQLGLSHIGLYRMLWHEASMGGEAIAWLP